MATIKDIVEKTGVSQGAVSRILTNDPTLSVSEETRNRVIHAANELGYKRKGRSSSSGNTFTLGILQWFSMQQEIEDSYYLYIRHGIEDFCIRNNINIIRAFKSDFAYMDSLNGADAVICIGKFAIHERMLFQKNFKKILFIDMDIEDDLVSTVTINYKNAMYEALNYLVENGHHSIGFLGGKEYLDGHILYNDRRKEYFEEYCKNNNIDYQPYSLVDRFSTSSGYNMMLSLIRKKKLPTAIFAASDSIAIGAIAALNDRGYSVPEQVSVIGFDDTDASAYTNPPLTTIHTPSYDMGYYGAGIIYHLLTTKFSTPAKVTLPCTLTIRSSVKNINE